METKTIEIFDVENKLPNNPRNVVVAGGVAYYDSYRKVWINQVGSNSGKDILWAVKWWAELIY